MTKNTIAFAIATLALACAGTAAAQGRMATGSGSAVGPWSAELGYTRLEIDNGGLGFNPGAVRGVLGYSVLPNLGVEGMFLFNANDDSASGTVGGVPASATGELRRSYGLFLKPKLMLGDRFEVFGRLGWAESRVRVGGVVGSTGFSNTSSGNDVAYGAGVNWYFGRTTFAGVDYMNYYDKSGTKIDGWSFNIGARF